MLENLWLCYHGINFQGKIEIFSTKFFTIVDFFGAGKLMSGLEEKLGPGHQQIVLGLLIFAAGALWGIMLASGEEIDLKDLFISAVIMLSGAMITMLGISFGTDNEDDRTNDLQDAITELTGMLNTLQAKVTGGSESEDE